jgi:hypothetical protein
VLGTERILLGIVAEIFDGKPTVLQVSTAVGEDPEEYGCVTPPSSCCNFCRALLEPRIIVEWQIAHPPLLAQCGVPLTKHKSDKALPNPSH